MFFISMIKSTLIPSKTPIQEPKYLRRGVKMTYKSKNAQVMRKDFWSRDASINVTSFRKVLGYGKRAKTPGERRAALATEIVAWERERERERRYFFISHTMLSN